MTVRCFVSIIIIAVDTHIVCVGHLFLARYGKDVFDSIPWEPPAPGELGFRQLIDDIFEKRCSTRAEALTGEEVACGFKVELLSSLVVLLLVVIFGTAHLGRCSRFPSRFCTVRCPATTALKCSNI